MDEFLGRIRPNILVAMVIVAALGMMVVWVGWRMAAPEIVTGAAGTTGTGIIALAMKILEKD